MDREHEVNEFWKKNDIFGKSLKTREGAPYYTFYDGPPTANGKPHIGHVLTRVIKDMIPRYHVMKGEYVPRKAGWDTHGLPVELGVEKELGLNGKEQIEQYGMEARSRSSSTAWSRSSKSARKVSGNIRECGRISPIPSGSGRI